jgi:hypothetical protein
LKHSDIGCRQHFTRNIIVGDAQSAPPYSVLMHPDLNHLGRNFDFVFGRPSHTAYG